MAVLWCIMVYVLDLGKHWKDLQLETIVRIWTLKAHRTYCKESCEVQTRIQHPILYYSRNPRTPRVKNQHSTSYR